jgi:hypothetical protein
VLRSFYKAELTRLAAEPDKASKIVHVGVEPVDTTVNEVQMAALTNVTAAVMNTPDAYSIH